MARGRAERGGGGAATERRDRPERAAPIPLEPVDLLAGLAPGLELAADDLPSGVAGSEETAAATVTVDEIGRLLRCSESTVRRLIRTAVLRPIVVDGQIRVRERDLEACRAALGIGTPAKPSE